MAGIAFNLIIIRVGQSRSDVDEMRGLDTQWVKKEMSVLRMNSSSASPQGQSPAGPTNEGQFNASGATFQDQSLVAVEEGIENKRWVEWNIQVQNY